MLSWQSLDILKSVKILYKGITVIKKNLLALVEINENLYFFV
jgi:hypothetical protein